MSWPVIIGLFILIAGLIYALYRTGIFTGRAEVKAEHAKAEKELAQKQADVIAEHRTVDDTIDSLRRGQF